MFFFFKQKTAYEMRISDWSSDVCSSDLADDYLCKPFDLMELAARIRALQRRATGRAEALLTVGDLTLDLARRSATLAGKFISLSRREFAVLRLLAEHPGHILSRAQIEDRLYGWQEEVGSNAVEVQDRKSTRLNSSH